MLNAQTKYPPMKQIKVEKPKGLVERVAKGLVGSYILAVVVVEEQQQ
jgi:hypothetical protein